MEMGLRVEAAGGRYMTEPYLLGSARPKTAIFFSYIVKLRRRLLTLIFRTKVMKKNPIETSLPIHQISSHDVVLLARNLWPKTKPELKPTDCLMKKHFQPIRRS